MTITLSITLTINLTLILIQLDGFRRGSNLLCLADFVSPDFGIRVGFHMACFPMHFLLTCIPFYFFSYRVYRVPFLFL